MAKFSGPIRSCEGRSHHGASSATYPESRFLAVTCYSPGSEQRAHALRTTLAHLEALRTVLRDCFGDGEGPIFIQRSQCVAHYYDHHQLKRGISRAILSLCSTTATTTTHRLSSLLSSAGLVPELLVY
ncbi:unnamed protein product [Boreogadus saida]